MAHTRNLVRRRLKAITAEFLADGLTSVDVVYRAHPSSANASYAELRDDLRRGYSRIQQLSEAKLEAVGQ
ncbi:ribonuclease P protein component [Lysinibacter cavernae]|uniref:Ribonuclease P protein component n=2 Tax=Lysinibacter cavernae TaxID=1640652 RepID=A0A7X5R3D5_9MICO|nr:ribonuclease P protein component [Lysinibacter cavernae]